MAGSKSSTGNGVPPNAPMVETPQNVPATPVPPTGTDALLAGLTVKNGKQSNPLETGVAMLFYSDSGLGKTHAVNFLPDETTVYLGMEGGDMPLEGKNIPILNIQLSENGAGLSTFKYIIDTIRVRGEILGVDFSKVRTLVLDHISEMERFIQFSLMNFRKKKFLELKEYGDTSQKMKEYMRYLRDLKHQGLNVVFMAHEERIELTDANGFTITKSVPKVSKKIVNEITGMMDVVGRLEVEHLQSGEVKRHFRIAPTMDIQAKCRWHEIYDQYGEYVPQDLSEVLKSIYTIRKARIAHGGTEHEAPKSKPNAKA